MKRPYDDGTMDLCILSTPYPRVSRGHCNLCMFHRTRNGAAVLDTLRLHCRLAPVYQRAGGCESRAFHHSQLVIPFKLVTDRFPTKVYTPPEFEMLQWWSNLVDVRGTQNESNNQPRAQRLHSTCGRLHTASRSEQKNAKLRDVPDGVYEDANCARQRLVVGGQKRPTGCFGELEATRASSTKQMPKSSRKSLCFHARKPTVRSSTMVAIPMEKVSRLQFADLQADVLKLLLQ